ncbi:hypothetical protein CMO96_04500 [Candidatus Woesebacteria bacterium]|nr:hypothetical protein [Candidatus Woesebacteria bacterium]
MYKALLLGILTLGFLLRIVALDLTPPSLNWDEASHGYNAYSILKTGKDEWGVGFPTIFRAYGDYKLPVYVYSTAVSEFFFGLNAFAVRLPSILAGIATIVFTYLLATHLFNRKIGILAGLLVAVEPWTLFLSRSALESNLSVPFIVSGVYFFILGMKRANFLPVSAVLLGLSVWTYNSARVFVPLLVVFLVLLYRRELLSIWKKQRIATALYFLILAFFLGTMFWQLINPVGQARYGKVVILDEGAIAQINEARNISQNSPIVTQLLHNKATYFTTNIVKNWVSHFSSSFLFAKGGSQFHYSVPGHGLLYPVNMIFFLFGIFWLLRKRSKYSWLVLGWLVLGPIPASLTREAPHVLRATTMLPLPMIVTAVGLIAAWKWWEKILSVKWQMVKFVRLIPLVLYFLLLAGFVEGYLRVYFTEYRMNYSWSWQYGYKEVVEYTKTHYDRYDRVIVTKKYGEPHEFFLFYWPWDPGNYIKDPALIRFNQSNWYWVDRFDKLYFVNDWEIPKEVGGEWRVESGESIPVNSRTLLITSPGNYPPGWNILRTVHFLDGKPAFDILEN